jgi:hypothetical protein
MNFTTRYGTGTAPMHSLKRYAVMFVREGLETEEFEETLEIFQEYNLGASHKVKLIFILNHKPL